MSERAHKPVLEVECGELLIPHPCGRLLDATVGMAGTALSMLKKAGPDATLIGMDLDIEALQRARVFLAERAPAGRWALVRASFARMDAVLAGAVGTFDAVLLDLGYSSVQLEDPRRGLSYALDGPLDMRLTPAVGPPASDWVNTLSVAELADVIRRFGEERHAHRVARAIDEARRRAPLLTTGALREAVSGVVSPRFRIKTLARVFQAIRICVNRELEALEEALPAAVHLLAPGGRLGVISFHSLEDRIVKRFMVHAAKDCICPPDFPACRCDHRATLRLVTRKPVRAGQSEIARNTRSRSATLRVAAKLSHELAA
jgi:16S rRNA (cytosine1402-N4)-methyltransferase